MGENFEFARRLVLHHLRKHYKKRGCDFFFKSKHVKVGLHNSLVGKVAKNLAVDGLVIIWNAGKRQHELTYRTNFKEAGVV